MKPSPALSFAMKRIALIGVMLLVSRVCRSAEIYVAPDGSDSNPGTKEKPFATLVAARDALRRANPGAMAGSTIYMRAGVYRLREKLTFGPQDSGSPNAKIVYRGFGDERPVLSGGVAVTSWTIHDPNRNIYKANVGKDLFRQVYIDGVPAIRARHPNGTIYGPFWRLAGADPANGRLLVPAGEWKEVTALGDMRGVELVHNLHWIQQRAKVGAVVDLGGTVGLTVDSPNAKSFFLKPPAWYGNAPCYFENSLAFVDQDREWFHDPASGFLYLKVPHGFDIAHATIEIPRLPTVLELDATPRNPVHDLEFHGIGFELSNWIRPSISSLAASQFAQPYAGSRTFDTLDYPQGVVKVRHASRIAFRGCHIRNTGATGIQFWQHVCDSDIEGCEFFDIAANAIEVDAESRRNPPPDEQSTGVAIWNNRIYRAGQVYTNGGALLAGFVRRLIVDHNEIHDMPYSGIQIGCQPGGYVNCGCTDNKVRFNNIYRCMLLHDDGGAIYTLGGQQRGTEILENYLHDLRRSPWTGRFPVAGIYLDNCTQFVLCARNVIENCDKNRPYGQFNKAKQNAFKDNDARNGAVIANAGIKPGYNPQTR
jgi:hypothetical protein